MANDPSPQGKPFRRETLAGGAAHPNILLVEDIDFMARLVTAQLHAVGYKQISIANDGAEAMELLQKGTFNVLITDWLMTPVGGRELCHNLRRAVDSPCPGIAIIAVSGFIDHNAVDEMVRAGVDEIVAKPLVLEELLKRIRIVLNEPRQFVRTRTYFGPDRRRRVDPGWAGQDDRRKIAASLEERPKAKRER